MIAPWLHRTGGRVTLPRSPNFCMSYPSFRMIRPQSSSPQLDRKFDARWRSSRFGRFCPSMATTNSACRSDLRAKIPEVPYIPHMSPYIQSDAEMRCELFSGLGDKILILSEGNQQPGVLQARALRSTFNFQACNGWRSDGLDSGTGRDTKYIPIQFGIRRVRRLRTRQR